MAVGSLTELLYANTASGTAKASFTSEVQINDTTGMGAQAKLPADFWTPSPTSVGRAIKIIARGVLSSTGTPTYTFTIRSGAAGATTTAILLGSSTLTTASGASNQTWELEGDVVLSALGAAGTNSSVRGVGHIISAGLNPVVAGCGANASLTTPVATTVDTSITNFINFNVTCSANSGSNTITLQQLLIFALN